MVSMFISDIVSLLWVFYNKLKVKGRSNWNLDSENSETKIPTWLEWIESKGITLNTAIIKTEKLIFNQLVVYESVILKKKSSFQK